MSEFVGIYQAEDGYVGYRPLKFKINESDIEDDMNEQDLEELFETVMYDSFEQKVYPIGKNSSEFIKWANEILKQRENEEQK